MIYHHVSNFRGEIYKYVYTFIYVSFNNLDIIQIFHNIISIISDIFINNKSNTFE